jgi:ribosomal protein L31
MLHTIQRSFSLTRSLANRSETLHRPHLFYQTVVQSDGSTITIKTSSPRPILTMTKDTRNHPLWNPKQRKVIDESAEITRFNQRYGNLFN